MTELRGERENERTQGSGSWLGDLQLAFDFVKLGLFLEGTALDVVERESSHGELLVCPEWQPQQ